MATLQDYINNKKPDEVIVSTTIDSSGTVPKIVYMSNPKNYSYVAHDDALSIAVLKDLDYVPVS